MALSPVPLPQPDAAAGWAERTIHLATIWRSETEPALRDRLLGDLWLIVNAALRMYLRLQASRYGVSEEDQRDIASRKTLELLQRFDGGRWDPAGRGPASLCTFLSTLARNGLIDHVRVVESKRRRSLDWREDEAALELELRRMHTEPALELGADRESFAEALCGCAAALTPRARKAWLLRVFYDKPSREIATHPEVAMKPATVDVTLARCRESIRQCMVSKGFDADDIPPGTFAALWETFAARHAGDLAALDEDSP